MITKERFDILFGTLLANPGWYFDKNREVMTAALYYHNLKKFTADELRKVFYDLISDRFQTSFPGIPTIKENLERQKPYKASSSFICRSKLILLRDMVREARGVIDGYGYDNNSNYFLGKPQPKNDEEFEERVGAYEKYKDDLKEIGKKYRGLAKRVKPETNCTLRCC